MRAPALVHGRAAACLLCRWFWIIFRWSMRGSGACTGPPKLPHVAFASCNFVTREV
jgi:hypothetical protein